MDILVWSDKQEYTPTDDDYKNAKERVQPVEPIGKLATVWGRMKSAR